MDSFITTSIAIAAGLLSIAANSLKLGEFIAQSLQKKSKLRIRRNARVVKPEFAYFGGSYRNAIRIQPVFDFDIAFAFKKS
jgi:hypothetical protein